MCNRMRVLAGAVVALLVALLSVHAQDANAKIDSELLWARFWDAMFNNVVAFEQVGPMHHGWLDQGAGTLFKVQLEPGEYAVAGACDEQCSRLDLEVTGRTAEMVSGHSPAADNPYIMFTVATAGTFTIRVDMAECTSNPCGFGAEVLVRRFARDSEDTSS